MLTADQTERYARHILLKEIGAQGQHKLLKARVLIVGAGGIGAPIVQYLAAAGVGAIGLVDDDVVALSNLQRQIIYGTGDIGAAKVDAAERRIAALNPDIAVEKHRVRLDGANARDLIANYDVVVEGVDNFETRFVLNSASIDARKPYLSSAIGRFTGQIALFTPYVDPGVLPCYRCLTPQAPPREDQITCAEEGVIGPLTGVVGALAAMEAIKAITGAGRTLAGRLMIYDGLQSEIRTVALPADPACKDCARLNENTS